MNQIKNVYCVGRNYRQHAAELGNDVPEEPMFFLKPGHALLPMDGRTLELPANRGDIHYEAELVLHIRRPYEPGIRANDMIDSIALGLDLTLREVQTALKRKGHPWLAAKGFKGSAPIGDFKPYPGLDKLRTTLFQLRKNGITVQSGQSSEMIFDIQQIIDYCGKHYGLDADDLIYTGTPAGVGALADGDLLELFWDNALSGTLRIAMKA
ncbi:fumarylacetoacetate hydrolase family protein [Paenibacillus senegalensis]|uniref:fumarylacetoacetate hydrolase family protein n=1 Tax=Paenibacillus senegalensis TaxID=1465766 RepID=UPI0005A6BDE5|nr:fumarylacetoacetate hydrolase family protein [Paenibacillus senegalensis]